MPKTAKYHGNTLVGQVGSPDDDIFSSEFFPDGRSAPGYTRRSLPSEMALDRITTPIRDKREDGYLPSPPMMDVPLITNDDEMQAWRRQVDVAEKKYLLECENADRARQRAMSITVGNVTGTFTGPPDRVRKP